MPIHFCQKVRYTSTPVNKLRRYENGSGEAYATFITIVYGSHVMMLDIFNTYTASAVGLSIGVV